MTLADQRPRLLLVSSFGERRGIPRNECTKTSFIAEGGQTESKGSVMRNRIVGIDPQDNQQSVGKSANDCERVIERSLSYRRVSKKNSTNSVGWRASGSQSFPKWALISKIS
jgi:hypothetical protein